MRKSTKFSPAMQNIFLFAPGGTLCLCALYIMYSRVEEGRPQGGEGKKRRQSAERKPGGCRVSGERGHRPACSGSGDVLAERFSFFMILFPFGNQATSAIKAFEMPLWDVTLEALFFVYLL